MSSEPGSAASISGDSAGAGKVVAGHAAAGEAARGVTWLGAPAFWAGAAFVSGRLVTIVAGLIAWAGWRIPPPTGRWPSSDHTVLIHGVLARLFDPWVAWDGLWYTSIAKLGYQSPQSPAFFPAYPYVIRGVALVTRSTLVAGVLVSLVCSGLAMVLLYRMVAARYDARTAAWTVAFLSLCPTSLFFGVVYGESLFLLLVLGSLALAERGMWVAACAVGALAALTRNTGVLVCLPLLFLYAERRHWTWRQVRPEWPSDVRLAWLALVPTGLLLYMAFLWSRFGDALAFVAVQRAWARSFALPPVTLWHATEQAGHALRMTATHWPLTWSWVGPGGDGQWMYAMVLLPFVALVAAVIVLVLAWRRVPAAYNAWTLAVIALPLMSPMRGIALFSFPRFLLMAFPLFLGAALLTAHRPVVRWTLIVVSVLLLAWLSASFALFSWVS